MTNFLEIYLFFRVGQKKKLPMQIVPFSALKPPHNAVCGIFSLSSVLFGAGNFFEMLDEVKRYPNRRDPYQRENDAGNEIKVAAKDPSHKVEVCNAYQQPIQPADNRKNQTDNCDHTVLLQTVCSVWAFLYLGDDRLQEAGSELLPQLFQG
jgi:hypothetical protein